jgi:hypothetical protein
LGAAGYRAAARSRVAAVHGLDDVLHRTATYSRARPTRSSACCDRRPTRRRTPNAPPWVCRGRPPRRPGEPGTGRPRRATCRPPAKIPVLPR